MMPFPDFNSQNIDLQWQRFCNLIWHNDELGIWLDISQMHVNSSDLLDLEPDILKAISSMDSLESGSISNFDENRQVGHYWLRNSGLAPTDNIANNITQEIKSISTFVEDILTGKQTTIQSRKFTDVLWIGIGGSGLGPKLILSSLEKGSRALDFHFIDNVDPVGISDTLSRLTSRAPTTLVCVVSKSGGTPEPNLAMKIAHEFIDNNGGSWSNQAIAVTMRNSKLDKISINESWLNSFDLPEWVGGRTSITSAVGLLPIALMDSSIHSFLEGASRMDKLTRAKEMFNNPAALLAASWFTSTDGKGNRDMVVLPYRDRLELFSKYLQQLVMESLGKKLDRQQNVVNQGLAVYGNKGSTDQHAYVQQLRDGIDNFFITFIEVLEDNDEGHKFEGLADYLSGFLHGTRSAISDAGRQSLTITLKNLTPLTMGALVALFERAVGLYAELIDINAYDQPGVEAGKLAAADILKLKEDIQTVMSDGKPRTVKQISGLIENSSPEAIFLILRHLTFNMNSYIVEGDWSSPNNIHFIKNG